MMRDTATIVACKALLALLLGVVLWHHLTVNIAYPAAHASFGDHASNSLLVLEAKAGELSHGHYSRKGFYHPGPFHLYVMAGGELLLHDALSAVASVEGAHHWAVALLNLLLLGLVAYLLSAAPSSLSFGLAAALFAAGLLIYRTPALVSVWPPHMQVIPMLLFTVALWASMKGERKALWPLVLASGIMVQSHASMIGLVPVMLLGGLCAFVALRLLEGSGRPVRDLFDWVLPQAPVCLPLGVLFLAPLLYNTLTGGEGDLRQFFGGQSYRSNAPLAALNFSLNLWGKLPWVLAGLLMLAAFARTVGGAQSDAEEKRSLAAAAFAFVIPFAALYFYALKGVDSFAYPYLGYWYHGAAAGFAALLALSLFGGRQDRASRAVSAGMALAGAGLILFLPAGIFDRPNEAAFELDAALARMDNSSGGGPLVLRLDRNGEHWYLTWSRAVGLVNQAARTRKDLEICLQPGSWQLLFHQKHRCEKPIPNGRWFLVSGSKTVGSEAQRVTSFSGATVYLSDPDD